MVNKLRKYLSFIIAIAGFVNITMLCSNTNASDFYDTCISQIGNNSAISKACSKAEGNTERRGAQWINGSSSFSTATDVYVTQESGTMTVYMHRAVLRGTMGVYDVKIVKTGLSDYVPDSYNSSRLGEIDWLNFSGSMGNSGYQKPSAYWTVIGKISGTLDIDKFREETGCETECDVPVYIYRCAKSGAAKPCGTDRTVIHFKVTPQAPPETPPTTADSCQKLANDLGGYIPGSMSFGINQALSGVIKNTGTKWEHTVFARPTDYIRFYHCYYPETQKVKISNGHREHNDHHVHWKECCSCGDEDGSNNCDYCCIEKIDVIANPDYPRGTYLAQSEYYNLVADPASYKFKEQVVTDNRDIPYNRRVSFGQNTSSRDTTAAAVASPELESSGYNCGTSPLGTYTIIGTDPRNCNKTSGINGGTWDPGTTFEQHIKYGGTVQLGAKQLTYDCGYGPSIDHDPHTNYWVEDTSARIDGVERQSILAQVVVPYNFDTEISVSMNTGSVVYPGATITSTVEGTILSKSNADVGSTYATITPSNSQVVVAEFTLPAWRSPGDLSGDSNSSRDPYSYASSLGGEDIQTRQIGRGPFNNNSYNSVNLSNWLDKGGEVRSVVPDAETGTKLCTLVGIWPSDSHNIPDQAVASGGNGIDRGVGYKIDSGPGLTEFGNWRISGVTCRTIAKKPTFQVWSGGIYTGNSIQTSITDKCLRSGVMIEQDCSRTVYGSWSEYEAIAIGAITNFASASGYGFSSTPDAHGNYGRDGGLAKALYNDSYNYSHATISNSASSFKGLSNISVDDAFLARIMSRYSATTSGYDSCNIGGLAEWQVRNAPGHVIVFRCNGTATISGNIITGHDRYYKIDDLPQVIIIANNINISSNVTEVDAWLIATNSTNYANGTINTCSQFHTGSTAASSNKWTAGNTDCSLQLTINGPIITGRIYLNRTYGAYPGDNSIEPAEIFNLRADAYLWAYSQSEDYHQAVTTYTRELAPRY